MRLAKLVVPVFLAVCAVGLSADPPTPATAPPDPKAGEKAEIARAIDASIGWAMTKDRPLLESVIAHGPDLFIFHPGADDTVVGWDAFVPNFDFWMNPAFRATRYEVRDLRINLSRSGDVAWWSAILDDCGEWQGKPGCWKDTRWTGVLEKRDGRWQIVQMHFSFATPPRKAEPTATPAMTP
jgi:ketosteroid isomerase-like protein